MQRPRMPGVLKADNDYTYVPQYLPYQVAPITKQSETNYDHNTFDPQNLGMEQYEVRPSPFQENQMQLNQQIAQASNSSIGYSEFYGGGLCNEYPGMFRPQTTYKSFEPHDKNYPASCQFVDQHMSFQPAYQSTCTNTILTSNTPAYVTMTQSNKQAIPSIQLRPEVYVNPYPQDQANQIIVPNPQTSIKPSSNYATTNVLKTQVQDENLPGGSMSDLLFRGALEQVQFETPTQSAGKRHKKAFIQELQNALKHGYQSGTNVDQSELYAAFCKRGTKSKAQKLPPIVGARFAEIIGQENIKPIVGPTPPSVVGQENSKSSLGPIESLIVQESSEPVVGPTTSLKVRQENLNPRVETRLAVPFIGGRDTRPYVDVKTTSFERQEMVKPSVRKRIATDPFAGQENYKSFVGSQVAPIIRQEAAINSDNMYVHGPGVLTHQVQEPNRTHTHQTQRYTFPGRTFYPNVPSRLVSQIPNVNAVNYEMNKYNHDQNIGYFYDSLQGQGQDQVFIGNANTNIQGQVQGQHTFHLGDTLQGQNRIPSYNSGTMQAQIEGQRTYEYDSSKSKKCTEMYGTTEGQGQALQQRVSHKDDFSTNCTLFSALDMSELELYNIENMFEESLNQYEIAILTADDVDIILGEVMGSQMKRVDNDITANDSYKGDIGNWCCEISETAPEKIDERDIKFENPACIKNDFGMDSLNCKKYGDCSKDEKTFCKCAPVGENLESSSPNLVRLSNDPILENTKSTNHKNFVQTEVTRNETCGHPEGVTRKVSRHMDDRKYFRSKDMEQVTSTMLLNVLDVPDETLERLEMIFFQGFNENTYRFLSIEDVEEILDGAFSLVNANQCVINTGGDLWNNETKEIARSNGLLQDPVISQFHVSNNLCSCAPVTMGTSNQSLLSQVGVKQFILQRFAQDLAKYGSYYSDTETDSQSTRTTESSRDKSVLNYYSTPKEDMFGVSLYQCNVGFGCYNPQPETDESEKFIYHKSVSQNRLN